MAAEHMARAGLRVTVADAMPTVGRKLLMAGKSGLNLTNDRPFDDFVTAYAGATRLRPMLEAFGPREVRAWAEGLGQPLFTGSSGHVFPVAMKASPLLRAWLARLSGMGVELRTRLRWTGGLDPASMEFGETVISADVVVLALGGASWRRLGSDGAWTTLMPEGSCVPFRASNMGFDVNWSTHMTPFFGQPVKPVTLIAGDLARRGEFVIGRHGIEGSGVYAVSRALRDGATLFLDLVPDLDATQVRRRLGRPRARDSTSNFLRKALKLDRARLALLNELARPFPEDLRDLPVKRLPVPVIGPRPMDEAISTAGGVSWNALDAELMLRGHPGVFAAGEMINWDAPTGGWLLTACLSTGAWAGRHAAKMAGA